MSQTIQIRYKKENLYCTHDKTFGRVCIVCFCVSCRDCLYDTSNVIHKPKYVCNLCITQAGGIFKLCELDECYMICEVCDQHTKNTRLDYTPYVEFTPAIGFNPSVKSSLKICASCYVYADWTKIYNYMQQCELSNGDKKLIEKINANNELAIKTIEECRVNIIKFTSSSISTYILKDIADIIMEYYSDKIYRYYQKMN